MQLLGGDVGVLHVNTVLTAVADFCKKTLSHLPSVSTINRIADQRISMAYKQVQTLSDEANITLQSDETRKYGETLEVFSVRDGSGTDWVLGL
jgi:hypothetical protein